MNTREELIRSVIERWQLHWMDIKGTNEDDQKNYFKRSHGIDANMRHDLAKRIEEVMVKIERGES